MAGSATILAGSFGLMTGEALLAAGAVLALAAPFAILAVATIKGEAEMRKFGASLIATGNYSGQTASSLNAMGESIAASSRTTESSTRSTIEALAASGKIGSAALGSLADAAQNYSKITGENASKFVKEYEAMGDHLVAFAVKHEDTYHDLTLVQVEHIALLVKEGKEAEAQAQLAADIDAASKTRLAEALVQQQAQIDHYGLLMKTMHGVADAAKFMWDQILRVGRPETPVDEVAKAQQRVDGLNSQYNRQNNTPAVQAARTVAEDALLSAQRRANAEDAAAKAAADKAAADHDAIQKKFGDGKSRVGRTPSDDNATALDTAIKAQLAAQLPLTANVEEIAKIKTDEVAAELKLQTDRIAKLASEHHITDDTKKAADAAYLGGQGGGGCGLPHCRPAGDHHRPVVDARGAPDRSGHEKVRHGIHGRRRRRKSCG
jgi:phage-related minor tail protein